jgi:hypothetical protein
LRPWCTAGANLFKRDAEGVPHGAPHHHGNALEHWHANSELSLKINSVEPR